MSTAAAIENVWDTYIWDNATISAYSDIVFEQEISDITSTDMADLECAGEINFFEFVVSRNHLPFEIGSSTAVTYEYRVDIRYTREQDAERLNYQRVRDALIDIETKVHTALGSTWQGTVDFYQPQSEPASINEATVADKACWRGIYSFKATKFSTAS